MLQAQTFLGVYYTEEEKEDMEKAVRFFHMAAEKDVSEQISYCFFNCMGLSQALK